MLDRGAPSCLKSDRFSGREFRSVLYRDAITLLSLGVQMSTRWSNLDFRRPLNSLSLALCLFGVSPAHAEFFGNVQGGTDFPQGAISFADAVVDYSPIFSSGPSNPHLNPQKALGVPDYDDPTGTLACADQATCTWVSLGDGGSLTLQFIDNLLTGSGDNAFDLWVFEVGADIEDTYVEISAAGSSWNSVGKVFGSTAGIDIDAYGFGESSLFSYVRLTDDPNEGEQFGIFVGADIDAVGAISTIRVPEPGSVFLVCTAICSALMVIRRR